MLSTIITGFPQQKNSVLFRGVHDQDETYDAYEKDITVVSFYFKEPRVFEYARCVSIQYKKKNMQCH